MREQVAMRSLTETQPRATSGIPSAVAGCRATVPPTHSTAAGGQREFHQPLPESLGRCKDSLDQRASSTVKATTASANGAMG